jgi:hypothetical protein
MNDLRSASQYSILHTSTPRLLSAWGQARIVDEKTNSSWFFDPRMHKILRYVDAVHDGDTKRYGQRLASTHELWIANRNFNWPGLNEMGIDPIRLAFCGAAHDLVETARDKAEKRGMRFVARDKRKVQTKIARIWGNPETFPAIRICCAYMTDKAGLGSLRIATQRANSFGPTGECLISPECQITRANDKLEQISGDAWARANGFLADKDLENQIKKANAKAYVKDFPVVRRNPAFAREYDNARAFLKRELAIVQKKNLLLSPVPAA